MKLKIFLFVLLFVFFSFAPSVFADTLTPAQKQALIAQLQQQIIQLQTQIAQILAQQQRMASCKPNWSCGGWSLCIGSQQNRNCNDLNNCGKLTGRPATLQTCTQKPGIMLRANGSDGPLNVFLTMGNGASATNNGIYLSSTINLQWTGVGVSSCVASDSMKPTAFSGFKSSTGTQAVSLVGKISSTATTVSKITDTFKINCVVTTTAQTVSDSVVVNMFYTVR